MNKSRPRATRELSASVAHQLNLYALAATAAGVGVLALAQPVEGKIVYTKAHKWLAPNSSFPLDLNHDGIVDFKLYRRSFIYHSTGGGPSIFIDDVRVKHPGSSNGVAGYYLWRPALAPRHRQLCGFVARRGEWRGLYRLRR